jgi:hypothetical protein
MVQLIMLQTQQNLVGFDMIFSLKIFFDFSDTLKNKAANHLAAFI